MSQIASKNIILNDKRTINGWAFFDWANSSYALVIAVAIFPIYYNQLIDDTVVLWGREFSDSALFSYSISFAYIIIALALPLLSGIADYGGRKMFFMRMFTIIGGLACISLYFFETESIINNVTPLAIGTTGFIIATIGFAGGQVFNNAYLPEIVTEDQYDRVSAKGVSYGFIGSVILLVVNLLMVQKPEWFGIETVGMATRISFVMVGLWWLGFSIIPFKRLPQDPENRPKGKLLSRGYKELKKVWGEIKSQANTKRFLFSFFFYNAGVQTVLYLASTFASDELEFNTSELILVILILQLVAVAGAYIFAAMSQRKSNKYALVFMLFVWIAICITAYFVQGKLEFYFIAAAVGVVMGGIQSVSRATYSKLIPEGTTDTASYFSFYDVLEKLAVVFGTFSFGLIDNLTGSMRGSLLALVGFFVIGLIILSTVKMKPTQTPIVN